MAGNPIEGPFPAYNGAPPDRVPRTLQQVLDEAKAIIFRDGGMDDEEYLTLGDFFTEIMTMAQAGGMPLPAAGAEDPQAQAAQAGAPEEFGAARGNTTPLSMSY